jgi:3-hydroxyisobutyrate dehydrogenase-like beta-hydroxyacid dehydrogenase
MSRVSVIGLGNMGAALAGALLDAGHEVTTWNRTPGKDTALVAAGVSRAGDVAEAFASDVVVLCLSDYAVGLDLLGTDPEALRGRTVVQLTAGTSDEAEDMAGWCGRHGAGFLAGMVMVYPSAVGTDSCRIVYAGDASLFEATLPVLLGFGGTQPFIGTEVGTVGSLTTSALECYYLGLVGFVHAAALAARSGVRAELLLDEVVALQDVIVEGMRDAALELDSGVAAPAKATVLLVTTNVDRIARSCRDLGVDPALPAAVLACLQKAAEAGFGDSGVAAAARVLAP